MRLVLLVLVMVVVSGCTLPQVRTVKDVNDAQPALDGSDRVSAFSGVPTLRIVVLDVGQGDAVLVTTPNGHSFLYDAGPAVRGVETLDAIKALGVTRLDSIVVSHAHDDHYGGVASVLKQVKAGALFEPGQPSDAAAWRSMYASVRAHGLAERTLGRDFNATDMLPVVQDSSVQVRLLSPFELGGDVAASSLVLLVTYKDFSAVLCGDIGFSEESRILAEPQVRNVTYAQLCHHGSSGSSSDAWLEQLSPKVVTASAGAGNPYGDPTEQAMSRARAVGAAVVRTDLRGSVTISTDGSRWAMSCSAGSC